MSKTQSGLQRKGGSIYLSPELMGMTDRNQKVAVVKEDELKRIARDKQRAKNLKWAKGRK